MLTALLVALRLASKAIPRRRILRSVGKIGPKRSKPTWAISSRLRKARASERLRVI